MSNMPQFSPVPIAWDAAFIASDGETYTYPVVGFVWDGAHVTTLVARGRNIGGVTPAEEAMRMVGADTFHLLRAEINPALKEN